jgi:hypothetical protein
VNAPVRFASANARLHAIKSDLLDDVQLSRMQAAPALCSPAATDAYADLYPPLVRWYSTLVVSHAPARSVLLALFRRHEIENLKLLWRCAVRQRPLPSHCWRPLGSLAALEPWSPQSIEALVAQLTSTCYARLADETWRSHGADLAAAELALEGWVYAGIHDRAAQLPKAERGARNLLLLILRERDLDLLRRGRETYRLEPSFAAGLTTVLKEETTTEALRSLAAWEPSAGPLAAFLPRPLSRICDGARGWDEVMDAVGRARLRSCRRALIGWPFQVAPAVAAVLLREDQMRVWTRLAAAGRGA